MPILASPFVRRHDPMVFREDRMRHALDVYYTLASPWSFLAWDRLRTITDDAGVQVAYHPVDYGVIFPATGGLPLPKRAPARQRYRLMELARWSKRLGIPLTLEPRFFPVNDAEAAGLVLAARERGADVWALSRAFMQAIWQQERDIADPPTQDAILRENGLEPAALRAALPAMAEVRQKESEAAVERGVFGAPFFVYGEMLLWGQDRLDFLEEVLAAS
jgi:carboxymethylenebutenolidase